jgi:DNA-binding Xre family transcriptional regulator
MPGGYAGVGALFLQHYSAAALAAPFSRVPDGQGELVMSTAFSSQPVRSLAAADTGEAIEIHRILFGALRELCADLDVHEGDVVRCRAGTASQLLLETSRGKVVAVSRDWARFIQIASPVPDAARHSKLLAERVLG